MEDTTSRKRPSPGEDHTANTSVVLQSILERSSLSVDGFFQNVWQKQAFLFQATQGRNEADGNTYGVVAGDDSWQDDVVQQNPLEETRRKGWHVLSGLLSTSFSSRKSTGDNDNLPLFFQDRQLLDPEHVSELYGDSPLTPFLDGCSVVLNHADLLSPWIAFICEDLQRSFPHAYANCYVTPASSQAVPPHADDRDVLILQLVGSKEWTVYQKVPIPYPYPDEQVGKGPLPVPNDVLDGPVSISRTLHAGDILYMPRGFVHQARCTDKMSFHATIALATHDWTLAGIMSSTTHQVLTRVIDFRQSILPTHTSTPHALEKNLQAAFEMLRNEITPETILETLKIRIEGHNKKAFTNRMKIIHQARFPPPRRLLNHGQVVGQMAAQSLSFHSLIRAATDEERQSVQDSMKSVARAPGLNVREEIADVVMSIVSKMKGDPSLRIKVINIRSLDPLALRNSLVCNLTLLSLCRRCVELGAFAVCPEEHQREVSR